MSNKLINIKEELEKTINQSNINSFDNQQLRARKIYEKYLKLILNNYEKLNENKDILQKENKNILKRFLLNEKEENYSDIIKEYNKYLKEKMYDFIN